MDVKLRVDNDVVLGALTEPAFLIQNASKEIWIEIVQLVRYWESDVCTVAFAIY